MFKGDGLLMKVFQHLADGGERKVLNLALSIGAESHSQVLKKMKKITPTGSFAT